MKNLILNRKAMSFGFLVMFLIVIGIVLMPGCSQKESKVVTPASQDSVVPGKKLIIFHAGSLAVPFRDMAAGFSKKYPDINIYMEPAGSMASARKIIDLNLPCDVIAVSDFNVIHEMLIPKYTGWNICFASNELVIAFTDKSKYSASIDSSNWYLILAKDDVRFGRSDPDQDPCGYRTVQMFILAEEYYGRNGLKNIFTSKDKEYIRPKEVDLLALLETNTIDYIFNYRSVAEQHNLNYITLPVQVNLNDPSLEDVYATAAVDIRGRQPGTTIKVTGQPMLYGISVLDNAPNREVALRFVEFVLSREGQMIMEMNGQPPAVPAYSSTYDRIPEQLRQYAHKEK
jgi:molybdate/tungstate transport system substrate-binding protein